MSDLVKLVADLIPLPPSHMVETWPEDEQDYFRNGDWGSFSDRSIRLARMRQEKAARAILAALNIDPDGKRHDHTTTDPWSHGPNGDTAYIDGCAIEADHG